MGKREPVALLSLSSWCLVMVVGLFLAVPWVCLRFVIVVVSDYTHLLFLYFEQTLCHKGFSDILRSVYSGIYLFIFMTQCFPKVGTIMRII